MKISKDLIYGKRTFYNFNSQTWRKSYGYKPDEIERRNIKIRLSQNKLNKIKKESIKDMIYANKYVPNSWRAKLNYQEQVRNLLANDENFLVYMGNLGKNDKNKNKIDNLKMIGNKKTLLNLNKNNSNKKLKLFRNKTMDDREVDIYLTNLGKSFPIKEKLNELFDDKTLMTIENKNKINVKKNNSNNDKADLRYKCVITEKKKNDINKNIFINLMNNKSRNIVKQKFYRVQSAIAKNSCIKKLDDGKKKYKIKDKYAMQQLESINYYGPYYSYCPNCGKRNTDFYNNINSDILIDIVGQIKKNKDEQIFKKLNHKKMNNEVKQLYYI